MVFRKTIYHSGHHLYWDHLCPCPTRYEINPVKVVLKEHMLIARNRYSQLTSVPLCLSASLPLCLSASLPRCLAASPSLPPPYMCVHIYIYIYVHMCIDVCIYIYIYIYIYNHICTHTHSMCTYIIIHVCVYKKIYIHTCTANFQTNNL